MEENPTIEVVIDLHRDGVADTTHLVTEVDGKSMAKVMFLTGLVTVRSMVILRICTILIGMIILP